MPSGARRVIPPLVAFVRESQWAIILGLGIIAFGLGVAGYARTERLLDAIYMSLKLFTLDFAETGPPWQLEVARFLAPATTALAGARAVITLFAVEVEQFRARRSRDHVVVCGLGQRGSQLVRGFRADGARVVGIEAVSTAPGVQACRLRGALVLTGDAADVRVLRRAAAPRARGVVAVCANDETNVRVANHMDELCASRPARNVITFVHVGEEELWRVLRERVVSMPSVELFNIFDRGARSLLRQYPPPLPPSAGVGPHVVVVGLGRLGREVLVAIARLWAFLSTAPIAQLRLTAVDPLAGDHIAQLELRYPGMRRKCDINVVTADTSTPTFEAAGFLFDETGGVDVSIVYVCLEDDQKALSAALALRRRLGDHPAPVVVQITSQPQAVTNLLAQASPGRPLSGPLSVFGLIEETCSPELLFDHATETLARALHEGYVRHQREAGVTLAEKPHLLAWDDVDERSREDSRAQARHIGVKLAAIGCDVQLLDDWDAPLVIFDDEEVERLAAMEHQRWLDARLADGWRHGMRDDANRIHPDVVPWSDLTETSREVDRAFARALPVVLAKAGFQIVRS